MSGKTLVFLKEVMSPVHGQWVPGDVAKNIDASFAADLITAGVAKETTSATSAKDAEDAATAAGRMTRRTPGLRTGTEKTFSAGDPVAQAAAGVIKPEPVAGPTPAAPGAAPAASTAPAAPSAPKATRSAKATDATKRVASTKSVRK